MKRKISCLIAVSALYAGMGHAALINAGFETGDGTGWTVILDTGWADVVTSHTTSYGGNVTYLPQEGNYFLAIGSGGADVWQTVTQSINLVTGDVLSGMVAFNWGDYLPYADGVRVRILNATGAEVAMPFYMDGSSAPYSGFNGPWTAWSWSATADGLYMVEYAVRNTLDNGGPEKTYGYFDAPQVNGIPEPASLALLGLGLAGLGALRRRKFV